MLEERKIIAYGNHFTEFVSSLKEYESRKIFYVLDMLKAQNRVTSKFVKHIRDGLYELRIEYASNIYRIFFCFDSGNLVVLFHGFQKKTKKTPPREIEKALNLMKEYYESKSKSSKR